MSSFFWMSDVRNVASLDWVRCQLRCVMEAPAADPIFVGFAEDKCSFRCVIGFFAMLHGRMLTVEFLNWGLCLSSAAHEHTGRGVAQSCRDVDGDQNRTVLLVWSHVDHQWQDISTLLTFCGVLLPGRVRIVFMEATQIAYELVTAKVTGRGDKWGHAVQTLMPRVCRT